MKVDDGKIGEDALARSVKVVVVCGSLSFRTKLCGVVERGFFVVGDWVCWDA